MIFFFVVVIVSLYVFSFGKVTNPQLLLPPLSSLSPTPVSQTQSQLVHSHVNYRRSSKISSESR